MALCENEWPMLNYDLNVINHIFFLEIWVQL